MPGWCVVYSFGMDALRETCSEPSDRIQRYDQAGPRYTSYPTAAEFHAGVDAEVYDRHLAQAAESTDEPLSLYLHLPFCEERCLYCACNVVITRKPEVVGSYLGHLEREIRAVAGRLKGRRRLRQMHWGGGTPTYSSERELRRLAAVVRDCFDLEPDAEIAIEIDPRVTSNEQLAALRELGFNRLSVGVQDFTNEVQQVVHRVQPFDETAALIESARGMGFSSINIDLIYGLPLQTPETFGKTLDLVLSLRPERVATYSYAHVPWLKVQQRRLRTEDLPSPSVKLELLAGALDAFQGAGYRAIGMDHFAHPDDELSRALDDGSLWRNFMGYTVRHTPDLIGCGLSAISDLGGGLFQNDAKLSRYRQAMEAGTWATYRGIVRSAEDQLRNYVINSLMCRFVVDVKDVETRFGLNFARTFANERAGLQPFAKDGLVEIGDDAIRVTADGRRFVRNICMLFDSYLQQATTGQQFSRTI